MKPLVVLDTACLICFERIGCLWLLPELFAPVAPPMVLEEFGATPEWLAVQALRDEKLAAALNLSVDAGEAAAIALAWENSCACVLDDRKARRVASQLGVEIMGSVAVLLRAKKAGLIPQVKPFLDAMDANGFRLSRALREEALRLADE